MKTLKQFTILLSAPGDVGEEIREIEAAVEQFSRTTGAIQDLRLEPMAREIPAARFGARRRLVFPVKKSANRPSQTLTGL